MLDSLPADVYFRLNPYMSHTYTLDETDSKKLAQMQEDAKQYVRKNKKKIHSAANQLVKEPVLHKHLMRNLVSWNHEKQLFGSGYNI
uniref:Uncharacterized protein n=1 Tax=Acrobeloides nanus TaxID=290746 RepID=A0A914CZT1_9BILA